MSAITLSLIQIVVIILLAPLSVGLTRFLKARLQGRHGARPWLPYITYATLLKKENIIAATGSWIFRVSPYGVLGSSVFLAMVLPLVAAGGAFASASNFIVVAAVLALGSGFFVLGALDAGGAYGGLGASRELTIVALLQPTVILIFVAFAFATGSTNIDGMITGTSELGSLLFGTPYLLLSLLALTLVSLAVNARSPVDDTTRITDLASVRETLGLEYSGPYLAMLEYASALKFTVFTLLVANVILPWPLLSTTSSLLDIGITILATLAKLVTVTLVIAVLESTLSQIRFYRIQEFLTGAFFMSLIGLILALLSQLL